MGAGPDHPPLPVPPSDRSRAPPRPRAGTSVDAFSPPSKLALALTGAGTAPGGAIWATFSLPWPAGSPALKVNIGAGSYAGGTPTGADGMSVHSRTPPTSCVGPAGGIPATC